MVGACAPPAAAASSNKAIKKDPIGRAVYETSKLLCLNARKEHVDIGKGFTGFQLVEVDVPEAELFHTHFKVMVGGRKLVDSYNAKVCVALQYELMPDARRLSTYLEKR